MSDPQKHTTTVSGQAATHSPSSSSAMARTTPFPLTLVVAATARGNGIGRDGGLPWRLAKEMKYFARVTTRVLPAAAASRAQNAVIMGRKTWDSIPPRFRPLQGRVNVVVTRSSRDEVSRGVRDQRERQRQRRQQESGGEGGEEDGAAVVVASSLEDALARLSSPGEGDDGARGAFAPERGSRAFVIGGASMYAEALRMARCDSILLTRVSGEFECDTFFPVDLARKDAEGGSEGEGGERWEEMGPELLAKFTGEDFGEGFAGRRERAGDVEWEYCLYGRGERWSRTS